MIKKKRILLLIKNDAPLNKATPQLLEKMTVGITSKYSSHKWRTYMELRGAALLGKYNIQYSYFPLILMTSFFFIFDSLCMRVIKFNYLFGFKSLVSVLIPILRN